MVVLAVVVLVGLGLALKSSNQTDSTVDKTPQSTSSGMAMEESSMSTSQATNSNEVAETNKVDIKDFAYVPAKIKIKKGTTVAWTNQDGIRHDVAPDNESADFKARASRQG